MTADDTQARLDAWYRLLREDPDSPASQSEAALEVLSWFGAARVEWGCTYVEVAHGLSLPNGDWPAGRYSYGASGPVRYHPPGRVLVDAALAKEVNG